MTGTVDQSILLTMMGI